jgi:hydrogenase nickel incorporation protein HypA/HybF
MHQFGLAEGVLETVRRRAAGRPVSRIRVRAGVRHGVDEESMAQAFLFVARGTEAAGAALDLVAVPVRLACRSCGFACDSYDMLAVCPRCDGHAVDLTGGNELVLVSLEYATTNH